MFRNRQSKYMNWLDIVLVLPLVLGLVRGLMRGLISEVIAIAVVILGVFGSRVWAPPFSAWLLQQFTWPNQVCDVVAYVLLFLGIAVVLSIAAHWINKLIRAIHLGWANRVFGGVFGIAKYGIIVLIAVFVLDRTNQAYHWLDDAPVVQTSIVYPRMVKLVGCIDPQEAVDYGKKAAKERQQNED